MQTPQQLSRKAIEEFKTTYRAEFGRSLSDEQVQKMAFHLLRFFGIKFNTLEKDISEPPF